ncbi:exocyst complex component Sec10-domain-containing protein [Gorgonomyces haynaldii]|nr:exocyst complex component Sec10-domain-containing protein [Gorgonomyces haynaldii]
MFLREKPKVHVSNVQITALPPDIFTLIFQYLPIKQLAQCSRVSRRFKVLTNSDDVYRYKLSLLDMAELGDVEPNAKSKDSLLNRLRQLPGGQYLPADGKFLVLDELEQTLNPPEITPSENRQISAALPEVKVSNLIIGAGGLKAALANQNRPKPVEKPKMYEVKKGQKSQKEIFKQVYSELLPYYLDFRHRQTDSKVFRDYKNLSEIGAVLHRLHLFDKALFFLEDMEDISFALQTATEWFESTLLGQFEIAYDENNVEEMRKNAFASFQLNGGLALVNLFISKNPVFFDTTFNPALVQSQLPALVGPSLGYALSDQFADYMDHLLRNCQKQVELVSKVFVPKVDAMTLFISKVFEDSISEYLSAVLAAAKTREDLIVYLHTLASSVYSCSQFVKLIVNNPYKVQVNQEPLRQAIKDIFGPYADKYIEDEMAYLRKKYKVELDKWDNRKKERKRMGSNNYLQDVEKQQQHKRQVMSTMKAIMFAPVAMVMGSKPNKQALLDDAEPIDSQPVKDDTVTYNLDDDSMNSLISLELRPNVQKVFIALLKSLGERHLKPAAIEILSKSQPVDFTEGQKLVNLDSLQFFDLIHVADLLQQMIDVYYNEDVRPWIDENDFLSDIVVEKKAFERILDDSVAAGMDKAIQVLVNQCEYLLISAHNLNDYNPPENGIMDWKPTKACQQVVQCLDAHTKVLTGVVEKHTMEVFFGEVGCDHQEHQEIQNHDLNRYHDWAQSLYVSQTTKLFVILKELGNLFLADGSDELKKLVHDAPRFQAALRVEEIYELLQSRTDYKKIQKQVEAKECCIQ